MILTLLKYCSILPFFFLNGGMHANYTSQQKAWSLATTALLDGVNWERNDILAGCERTPENIEKEIFHLKRDWRISSKIDFLLTLHYLDIRGHREQYEYLVSHRSDQYIIFYNNALHQVYKDPMEAENRIKFVQKYHQVLQEKSLIAWDYCRYIYLCRKGYLLGYLSEEQAWDKIMPAARKLQKTYSSWSDLGKHYLIGRQFWSLEHTHKKGLIFQSVYIDLIADPHSPWSQIPWDLDLSPKSLQEENHQAVKQKDESYIQSMSYYKEAVNLRCEDQYDDALEAYNKAIKIAPNNYRAWNEKGLIFENMNQLDKALDCYEQAISINPDFALGWSNKGNVLDKLAKLNESLQAQETALQIQPYFSMAWSNKGYILAKMDRLNEALEAQDKAIDILPAYPLALYNRACVLSRKGNIQAALADLQTAISLDRNYKEFAKEDEDFSNLRSNPAFIEMTR